MKKRYSSKKSSEAELIAILVLIVVAMFHIVVAIFHLFKFLYDKLFGKGKIERIQTGYLPPNIPIPRSTVIKEYSPREVDKYCPPTRKHAKPELDKFLDVKRKTRIIIFDVETNGLNSECSVLSCSAIKYEIHPSTYQMTELGRFNRYYYPRESFNTQAIAVNGLTKEVLAEKRLGVDYPEHFHLDNAFEIFSSDAKRFIAHNISFDTQFIPFIANKKKLCTMRTNMDIVAAGYLQWKREWKWPKLSETAVHYGIPFNESELHDSMIDTEITSQIFFKMLEEARK